MTFKCWFIGSFWRTPMKIAGRGGLNDAYFLKKVAIMFIDSTADANNNNQVKSRDDFSSRLLQKGSIGKSYFLMSISNLLHLSSLCAK